jgi:tryptophanyl-tRNA synthetase
MSLQNPQIKMSKSDENENSTIFITDSDDQNMKKFKKAVTDSGTEIEYSDDKPGIKNLINIQAAITGKTPEEIVKNYQGKLYGHLKIETAEMVIETLRPIKEKISIYLSDKIQLENLLKDGALKAKEIASKTLKRTYEAIGFI